jgi:succinate-semialdehyde dehydrogenase/glutarate-semialdehyde dehydrogenase
MMRSINPATGETLAEFPLLSKAAIESKLELARTGFQHWSRRSPRERAGYLLAMASLLEEDKQRLARLVVAEMGKPLASAIAEVEKCAYTLRFYADHGPAFLEPESSSFPHGKAAIHFLPLGPLLAVMPWNFPLFQVVRFLAPALMSGNTVLLKHAGNVPQAALALEEICRRAELPQGVFQALLISAEMVPSIIADARIAAVTLTGSEGAGRSVASAAGKALKKCVLELGGSDPLIVMPSADIALAARTAVKSRMSNNGQSCICAKRFIVADQVFGEFSQAMLSAVESLRVGDPLEPSTDVGPLISSQAREEIDAQVKSAVTAGGRVLIGGSIPSGKGYFYPPTVIADLPEDAAIGREEFFGPVALLYRAKDRHHALKLANDTPFGLGSSVWTRDDEDISYFTREIEAGMTFINAMVASDPHVPFGGMKLSGYGREFGAYGLKEFVNIKTVVMA